MNGAVIPLPTYRDNFIHFFPSSTWMLYLFSYKGLLQSPEFRILAEALII